jgi:hypothetical protein
MISGAISHRDQSVVFVALEGVAAVSVAARAADIVVVAVVDAVDGSASASPKKRSVTPVAGLAKS